MSLLKKYVFLSAGMFFTALGLIGIVVPLLPTTPFLLLAAFFFLRSSSRLHKWLLGNSLFGKYLDDYYSRKKIATGVKVYTLSLLWIGLTISMIFIDNTITWILLPMVGIAVSWHILSIRS